VFGDRAKKMLDVDRFRDVSVETRREHVVPVLGSDVGGQRMAGTPPAPCFPRRSRSSVRPSSPDNPMSETITSGLARDGLVAVSTRASPGAMRE
jgi:hypothetical protein